jgi:mono/diheme cytochrome c family protein
VTINYIRPLVIAALALGFAGQASAQQHTPRTGKQVFETLCQACHMPGGVGDAGTYPALAKNPKLADGGYPTYVVLRGLKAMPAFGAMLSDDEIAGVVAYVRTSFGNKYPKPVTAASVKALRQ